MSEQQPIRLARLAGALHRAVQPQEQRGCAAEENTEAHPVGIEPPSVEVLERRLRERGESSRLIGRRVRVDRQRLLEIREFADFVIVNDDLSRALGERTEIVDRILYPTV